MSERAKFALPNLEAYTSLRELNAVELAQGELSLDCREEIRDLAAKCFRAAGLDREGWRFAFHEVESSNIGICYGRAKLITLSPRFFTVLKHPALVRQRIFHEIAHGLCGASAKSQAVRLDEWQQLAHGQAWADCMAGFGLTSDYGWAGVANDFTAILRREDPSLHFEPTWNEVYSMLRSNQNDAQQTHWAMAARLLSLLNV